jgi:hypothetical protein
LWTVGEGDLPRTLAPAGVSEIVTGLRSIAAPFVVLLRAQLIPSMRQNAYQWGQLAIREKRECLAVDDPATKCEGCGLRQSVAMSAS